MSDTVWCIRCGREREYGYGWCPRCHKKVVAELRRRERARPGGRDAPQGEQEVDLEARTIKRWFRERFAHILGGVGLPDPVGDENPSLEDGVRAMEDAPSALEDETGVEKTGGDES